MRNSGYSKKTDYKKASSGRAAEIYGYVDGSAARRMEVGFYEKQRRKEKLKELKRKQAAVLAAERRAAARRRAAATFAVGFMICSLAALSVICLNESIRNTELSSRIAELEDEYDTIVSQNDSKEYDINSAVNVNEVIETATGEYGMVRATSDQIITYTSDDAEYIQQVAELPD